MRANVDAYLRGNTPIFRTEHRIRNRAGTWTWVASLGQTISLKPGGPKDHLMGIAINITDRKLAEEELQFTNAMLRTQQDASLDGILVVTEDSKVVSYNQRFVDMWGVPTDLLATQSDGRFLEYVLKQLARPDEFLSRVQYLYEHRDEKSQEEIELLDGTILDRYSAPMFSPDGRYFGRVWYFRDITDRKKAEKALRESEGRVRKKLDAILLPEGDIGTLELADVLDMPMFQSLMTDLSAIMPCAVAILDRAGNILLAVGWQDICAKFHRVHPEACKNCLESDTILSGGAEQGEYKIYECKNNLCDVAVPIVVGGSHVGNLFLGQIILEDKPVDYELFRAQARKYGFDEKAYLEALDRVPRWSRERVEAVARYLTKLSNLLVKLSYSSIKLSRSLNERERAEAELCKYRDHLEELVQQRTTELVTARDEAQAADRAKSVFLATMSHEIRTPMTAILGYADLLLDPNLNSSTRNSYAGTIHRSGEHLLTIINDILDLSKIESGKMEMDFERCSLVPLLIDVSNMLRSRARQRGLELSLELAGALPEMIVTDVARLRQAIVNLAGNAIKFTEKGSVRIVARYEPKTEARPSTICIQCIDTGIGIGKEILPQLFVAFHQGDASVSRRYGGTGLGLAISHRIAKMLGGDLTVESEVGRGSTFTLTIPTGDLGGVRIFQNPSVLLQEPPEKSWVSESETLKGVKVLLAEDGIDNRELIEAMLVRMGAEVAMAENGRVALEKAAAQTFDVVLMDMNMPEMDGYEATGILRDRGFHAPIIALTANAMLGDEERCEAAGCDGYLAKPINRTLFIQTIAQMVRDKAKIPPMGPTDSGNPSNADALHL
jgi:signal transduction histidine kinase/PAS domain-containing protein/ActR/RegA family two-component response regulator